MGSSIFHTGAKWALSSGFSGRNGMIRDIGTASSGLGTKQAPGFGRAGPGGLEEKPWRRATLPRPIAAVPSPLGPFTSVFGMGTGVASPPWPPRKRERKTRTAAGMPRHGTGSAASMPRHGTKDESKAVRSVPAHTCAGRRRMLAPGQPSREHGSEAKCKEGKAQASRTISTGRVNASPRLRLRPIEVVVFHRP